jgi:hypothetical protein
MRKNTFVKVVFFTLFFFTVSAVKVCVVHAEEDPGKWKSGFYLLAGTGPSVGIYDTEYTEKEISSLGMNIYTSFGYYRNNFFALEIGSIVTFLYHFGVPIQGFQRYEDDANVLSWNSSFFAAIRTRVPLVGHTNNFNPFVKTIIGRGSSVGFITGLDRENHDLKKFRLNQEGPVFGFSLGNMFNSRSSGRLWFVEFTYILQIYRVRYMVEDDEELPIVAGSEKLDDRDKLHQYMFTVGMRIF